MGGLVVAVVVQEEKGETATGLRTWRSCVTEEEAHYYYIIRMPNGEGHKQKDRQTHTHDKIFHFIRTPYSYMVGIDYRKQVPRL